MKQILITTIAAVMLVGCATTQPLGPPTAKAPEISIHKAAYQGNIEAVKQHIAAGTDVNAKNKYGGTPLFYAGAYGYKDVVELLIAEGADVNAKSAAFNQTPIEATNETNHPEIADLLRKHGGKTGEELEAEGK